MLADVLNLQPRPHGRHDEIADFVRLAARAGFAAGVGVGEAGRDAAQHQRRVHRRRHDQAARACDAPDLAKEEVQILNVLQDQAGNGAIARAVGERPRRVQIVGDERDALGAGGGASLRARLGEHALREVDRRHAGAAGREPQRVPPGSTADVRDVHPAHVAEQRVDARFLQRDERVAVGVVDLRPAVVAGARVDIVARRRRSRALRGFSHAGSVGRGGWRGQRASASIRGRAASTNRDHF